MKIERTKNAMRNIAWGIIEKIVSLLLPFLTRSVMIKMLGAEYLGLDGLFTSILSVLSISELGFGTAIVFSMYKPIAEDDTDTLCALLNMYKKVYHIIGNVILVLGVILTPFLPYLIKGSYPNNINIYVLYIIYVFNTVVSYYLFAYKTALFSAYQRNDVASKRSAIISLFSNVFKIVVLLTIRSYYVYVIIIPLTTIITNIANAVLASRMFPNIECRGSISKEMKEAIKKRITGLVSFKIYNVIFSTVDSLVISAFLGLVPLAMYNNYYYIQTAVIGFLAIFTSSITAGVGNKMVTNSKEDNYKDFKKFTFINGWICGWCAVCLFCLYDHFMKLWVGERYILPFGTMILMVFYFLLPRITTLTYTYREAAGLWWEDRHRPLIASVVNFLVNLALVQVIGLNGVIISTLICTIFINVPWGSKILFDNYFKMSCVPYFKRLIYYTLVIVIAGSLTWFACGIFPDYGMFFLLLKGCVCVVIPNMVFMLFYHKMDEFEYARHLLAYVGKKMLTKLK